MAYQNLLFIAVVRQSLDRSQVSVHGKSHNCSFKSENFSLGQLSEYEMSPQLLLKLGLVHVFCRTFLHTGQNCFGKAEYSASVSVSWPEREIVNFYPCMINFSTQHLLVRLIVAERKFQSMIVSGYKDQTHISQ